MQNHLLIFLTCLILQVFVTEVLSCNCCAEEGKHKDLQSKDFDEPLVLKWQLEFGSDQDSVVCGGSKSNDLDAEIVRNRQISTRYHCLLHIFSANRNKTRFYLVEESASPRTLIQRFDIQVYVKPEEPQCQDPVLEQHGTAYVIKVNCTSGKVYPKGECSFEHRGLPSNATVNKSIRNRLSTVSPGDYQLECELLVPVEGLDEGSRQFRIKVFPNLTSCNKAFFVYGEWTSNILLNHTRISLAPDCPRGEGVKGRVIMAGTTAHCRCQVTLEGYPPGYAQWYTSSGTKIGTPNFTDKSSTITLEYNSLDKTPTYYCQAESVLKVPQAAQAELFRLSYSPLFAIAGNDDRTGMESSTQGDSVDTQSISLGVGLGLALLIIIIGAAVVILYRRRKRAISNSEYSRPGSIDPDYHEYSRPYRVNGPPRHPLPRIPESDHYDFIPLKEEPGSLKGKNKVKVDRKTQPKERENKEETDHGYTQPEERGNKEETDHDYTQLVDNSYKRPVDQAED